MDLIKELQDVFGQGNLVYPPADRLNTIEMLDETRELILKTGFPNLIGYFRFSMDSQHFQMTFRSATPQKILVVFYNWLQGGYPTNWQMRTTSTRWRSLSEGESQSQVFPS
jgi:hypothetical protein